MWLSLLIINVNMGVVLCVLLRKMHGDSPAYWHHVAELVDSILHNTLKSYFRTTDKKKLLN